MADANPVKILSLDEFQKLVKLNDKNRLGKGSFGTVSICSFSGSEAAMKNIYLSKSGSDLKRTKDHITSCCQKWNSFNNENIIKFYALFFSTDEAYIVMELAHKGTLKNNLANEDIKENGGLRFGRYIKWCKDICSALHHLHSCDFVHRDLKCDNFLIDKNDVIKLCDFDFLRQDTKSMSSGGCMAIVAPELWDTYSSFTKSGLSDIWSLSMVFLEMVICENPVQHHPAVFAAKMKDQWRPKIPETCPNVIRYIIEKCWMENPRDRPTAKMLLDYFTILEASLTMDEMYLKLYRVGLDVTNKHMVCEICGDILQDPVTLQCYHSCCKEHCMLEWSKRYIDGKIVCPGCRKGQNFPHGLMETYNCMFSYVVEKERHAVRPCPSCGKSGVLQYCTHCHKFICKHCHDMYDSNTFENMKEAVMSIDSLVQDVETAQTHYEFAEKELCQAAAKVNQHISKAESVLKAMGSSLNTDMQSIETTIKTQLSAIRKLEEDCIKWCQGAIKLKNDLKEKMLEWGHAKNPWGKHLLKEWEKLKTMKPASVSQTTPLVPNKCTLHISEGTKHCRSLHYEELQYLKAREIELNDEPTQMCFCNGVFCVALANQNFISFIGVDGHESETTELGVNLSGVCGADCNRLVVTDKCNRMIMLLDTDMNIIKRKDGALHGFPFRVAKLADRIYVACTKPNRVAVLDNDLEFINLFGQGIIQDAFGMSFIPSENKILATDRSKGNLHIFTQEGGHITTISMTELTGIDDIELFGVAVDNLGYVFLAVKSKNGRAFVQVLKQDLSPYLQFGEKTLKSPRDICIMPNGDIAVSDNIAKRIFIF